jgi:hypothetical protein
MVCIMSRIHPLYIHYCNTCWVDAERLCLYSPVYIPSCCLINRDLHTPLSFIVYDRRLPCDSLPPANFLTVKTVTLPPSHWPAFLTARRYSRLGVPQPRTPVPLHSENHRLSPIPFCNAFNALPTHCTISTKCSSIWEFSKSGMPEIFYFESRRFLHMSKKIWPYRPSCRALEYSYAGETPQPTSLALVSAACEIRSTLQQFYPLEEGTRAQVLGLER